MELVHEINEEAWAEWVEFRSREKKVKIGPMAERKQRKLLAKYPPPIQQEIIDHSIQNSYQGLFPPKGGQSRELATTNRRTRHTSLADDLHDTSWVQ